MSAERHSDYQDSGVGWLGSVPAHWNVTKLKHEAPFQVGWTPPTKSDANFEGDNLWANISDLKSKVILDTAKRISDGAAAAASMDITPKGSLLYSFKLSVGAVAFAGADMYTNEAIASFLDKRRLPLDYMYYAFPIFVIHNASTNIYGARILNQDLIKNADLLAPPYDEAAKIAKFLDYETLRIDALIEKQQQLIALLKEKRQAVISHAVTKGLNPDAPMRDSGVEWLGEVPAHWKTCRVKQATSFITSGPRGWSELISDDGSDIFLQSGDLNDKLGLKLETTKRISPPRSAEGVRTRMQDGDVVVCITGANTGRVAVAGLLGENTVFINQHLSLIRAEKKRVLPGFLATILSSSPVKSYFAIKQYGLKEGLSLSNIAETPLCLPPSDEQMDIIEHVSKVGAKMDQLEALAIDQVVVLQERRTALISAAVTGKIDVRDWQPPKTQPEAA